MRQSALLTAVVACAAFGSPELAQPADNTLLWYDKPATEWEKEALPIGNGRIGAMVFGGVASERLQISEKSLWTGGPGTEGGYDYGLPAESQVAVMTTVGKQLLDGATLKPEDVAKQLGRKMHNYGDYQSFGDLLIELESSEEAVTDYRRELDLQSGSARVKYKQGMVGYRREYFVSYPDQVLVGRWYSTAVQKIRVRYAVPDNRSVQTQVEVGKTGARIGVSGALKSNGLKYAVEILVIPDCGAVTADGESLRFEGDCAVTIILAARTNYSMRYPDYRAAVDPAAVARADTNAAAKQKSSGLTATARGRPSRAVFAREPGPGRAADQIANRPAARPERQRQCGRGSRARGAVLQLRPLPADRLFACGIVAGEPAGRVERQGHAAVECRLPRQHQPADELLAGRERKSRRNRRLRCSISSITW